ncbi:MAG TPA: hypothetical protein VLX68_07530 [Chitinivibrionales bacterium]|nr:hypothetical protein [Chitinivibrionales bacterium]
MKNFFAVIPSVLYLIVGVISLTMAQKSLFAINFLPFHEHAAGGSFNALSKGLQQVILALMETTGLGFLIAGILLILSPLLFIFKAGTLVKIEIPSLCALYSLGLCLTNLRFHRNTGADTPWKGSLIAAVLIIVGIVLSSFSF